MLYINIVWVFPHFSHEIWACSCSHHHYLWIIIRFLFIFFSFSHITGKLGNYDQTVKIVFESEAENIPLGEVSVTSHTCNAVFFTITKANGPQKEDKKVWKSNKVYRDEYCSIKVLRIQQIVQHFSMIQFSKCCIICCAYMLYLHTALFYLQTLCLIQNLTSL